MNPIRCLVRGAAPLLAALLATAASPVTVQAEPVAALIIDDIGYRRSEALRAMALPAPIGFAVLPHSPHGKEMAERAHARGREVLLHQPLTPEGGRRVGSAGIGLGMSPRAIAMVLSQNLAVVPHAIGVNNHMGSAYTADPVAAGHFARVVGRHHRHLFVLDSRTSARSTLFEAARGERLRAVQRDVFLDHVADEAFVHQQLDLLVATARRRGTAIAIGHPYPETLRVLEQRLPTLGVRLVPPSAIVKRRAGPGPAD